MQSHLQKLPPMAANLRRNDDDKRRETTRDDERRRDDASHANTAPTPRPPTINGKPSLRIREQVSECSVCVFFPFFLFGVLSVLLFSLPFHSLFSLELSFISSSFSSFLSFLMYFLFFSVRFVSFLLFSFFLSFYCIRCRSWTVAETIFGSRPTWPSQGVELSQSLRRTADDRRCGMNMTDTSIHGPSQVQATPTTLRSVRI